MNNIKKNYLFSVAYEILVIIIPLITSPYLSRILGSEAIGQYTYQFSIVSYFLLFARLGVVSYGSRAIAGASDQDEVNKIFSGIGIIQLILALLVGGAYVLYVGTISRQNFALDMVLLLYIVASIIDVNWYFFGKEQFKVTVLRNIVVKVITTVAIFLFVRKAEDLLAYAVILALGNLIGQMIVLPYLRGSVRLVKVDKGVLISMLIPMLVLFLPQIAVSLYKMMDKIMLGWVCEKSQLAFYEYASIIVGLPLGFITSLGTVMMPRITALNKDNNLQLSRQYLDYSLLFVCALSVAFAFGISAVAPVFIPFYFGDAFAPTVNLLVGLSVTLPFLAWANVIRTQLLLPNKKDKEFIISLFSGAAVNLVLNVLLIPRIQAMGAVVGTIAAEITVCLSQTIMVRKSVSFRKNLMQGLGFMLPGVIMFLCVKALALVDMPSMVAILVQVAVGVVVYGMLSYLYVVKLLKIDLLQLLKNRKVNKNEETA